MTPADTPLALLAALRRTPQVPPAQFLARLPWSWVQYFDDTPARDASQALAARRFDPATARRKQEEQCAVCFSLQAFGESRTKAGLLCFRNLGVDIDLVPAAERGRLTPDEIDRRKEEYLASCLLLFPLRPHWLTETRHGFHAVFRVMPRRDPDGVREGEALSPTVLHDDVAQPGAKGHRQVRRYLSIQPHEQVEQVLGAGRGDLVGVAEPYDDLPIAKALPDEVGWVLCPKPVPDLEPELPILMTFGKGFADLHPEAGGNVRRDHLAR